ncbi:Hypothetical predicted protein [Cloeon dipterum]|uniref:Tetratricopeptide SHNi-TPR domain-containing protein n=1 Tax=Cloeon dipterum TaxID=197152 RepID=A0A8S1DID8_9INSE|nr:Hypothetical predicted protein [Cloeon dipterum]
MGLNRVCQELLKSARLAFVKQEWSQAANDLSALLNEVRDTPTEVDLVMAPVQIFYAFCILRQIATKEENPEEKPVERAPADAEPESAGPSGSAAAGPSTSAEPSSSSNTGAVDDVEEEEDDDELEEPAKSLMIAWQVLLLAKSIYERFPEQSNKLEELHALQLQAEILFLNNDSQCLEYLDKIVEELGNFPYIKVWPIKILTMKAAYLLRFKEDAKFAENLNIIYGRLEDAMSEVQQPEGQKVQKLFQQVEEDVKAMHEAEKVEIKAQKSAKKADDLLGLSSQEMRNKIESRLLALCSSYSLPQDESGTPIPTRIIEDVNEIIADELAEESPRPSAPSRVIESETIGFGAPSSNGPSAAPSSSLSIKRKVNKF